VDEWDQHPGHVLISQVFVQEAVGQDGQWSAADQAPTLAVADHGGEEVITTRALCVVNADDQTSA